MSRWTSARLSARHGCPIHHSLAPSRDRMDPRPSLISRCIPIWLTTWEGPDLEKLVRRLGISGVAASTHPKKPSVWPNTRWWKLRAIEAELRADPTRAWAWLDD